MLAVTIMEPQDAIVSQDADVIEIGASQLEEFLAANDGTAVFVDQHGNTIRLTAQELLNAGFAAESLEESSLAGITDVSTYADGSGGGFYVIETGDHEPPRLELVMNLLRSAGTWQRIPIQLTNRNLINRLFYLHQYCCALVGRAEVYVDAQYVPDSVTATVCVKRPKPNEAPPEDAIVVQLDSGESCFVIAQDLSGQTLRSHGGSTENEKRNAMLRCDRCPRRFALESELTYHQKNEHPPRFPFYCRYCDKELLFITERDFQAHGRMFHRKQITGEIDTMSNAVKSEEEEPQWELLEMEKWNEPSNETDRVQGGEHKCTVCFRNFPTAFSASRHVREEHMITDAGAPSWPTKRSDMSLCEVAFSEKESLAKHMRSHGGSLFPCSECDKKFVDENFLLRHMFVHTGVKKYVCEVCGKVFSVVEQLAAHKHVHKERKFACDKCDWRFLYGGSEETPKVARSAI
uniref:C2H2-type domain-containing protein n=1 Tax=Trichuris muris TaxID=70415 RepID=A0A5S6Q0Q3_TRIMR